MKKLLLLSIALCAFSLPALAFSLTQRVEATYRVSLGHGWDMGVQGQLSIYFLPEPLGVKILARPYIRYTADLVDDDTISLSVFVRARLPMEAEIVPAPAVGSISLDLQAGMDFTYYVSEELSLLAGLEFDNEFSGEGTQRTFSGFSELDLELDDLTLYAGVSLDDILPPQAYSLYLGISSQLNSATSLSLECGYSFANASRKDDLSLTGSISFRLR